MKAKRKTVFKSFGYTQCDSFADYLSRMAAKGWHFKEWTWGLVFEQGEPEDAVYTVEVFNDASDYDMKPEPNTEEFAEYCEAAGWKLVDAKQKFCIFKRIREDAVDIVTPEERFAAICKEVQKPLWSNLVLKGLWWMLVTAQFFGYGYERRLFTDFFLIFYLFVTGFLVESIVHFVSHYAWKSRMKKRMAAGETIAFTRRKHSFFTDCFLLGWVGLSLYLQAYFMIIGPLIIIGVIVGFEFIMAKVRPSRDTHYILNGVFGILFFMFFMTAYIVRLSGGWDTDGDTDIFDDSIEDLDRAAVVYGDYGEQDIGAVEDVLYGRFEGTLGYYEYAYLFYEEEDTAMCYDVYVSPHDWIVDHIWKDQLKKHRRSPSVWSYEDCTTQWGALEACVGSGRDYFVRFENAVLHFENVEGEMLTEEQIAIILEKLELK